MIDGKIFFDQPVKNDSRTNENIRKIPTCERNYYTSGCLLDYNYFKNYYKMIAIDFLNNKHLTLIRKQYSKLVLLGI